MFENQKSNLAFTIIATVVGTIIAGAICAFFAPITPTISGTSPVILTSISGLWNFLWSSAQITIFWLLILVGLGIPTLIQLLGWSLNLVKRRKHVERKSHFVPLEIKPGVGNDYLKNIYVDPPSTLTPFCGAEFLFDRESLAFSTNKQIRYYFPRDGGKEVELKLPKPVAGVKSVYVLINSGNSQKIYEQSKIGEIGLIFKQAPPILVPLILGENIREWCPGNPGEFVRETTSEALSRVWDGMGKAGSRAIIDCLKIPVFDCMRNCQLEKITFFHKVDLKAPDTLGVQYFVSGISLEVEKEPAE